MNPSELTPQKIRPRAALGAGLAALAFGMAACGSPEAPLPGLEESARPSSRSPSPPSTPEPTTSEAGSSALMVSGDGVGAAPYGTGIDEALTMLTERLGEPDDVVEPQRYLRIDGRDRWYEDAGDPLSPSWPYRVATRTCWDSFCAIFGGDTVSALALRGWELSSLDQRPASPGPTDAAGPGVRLEGSGITLGDSWTQLQAAYPDVVSAGAEGSSLRVDNTPWPAIFDGAGAWRLSGSWDYEHPSRVPPGSVVTRLSGGEGPEPGCC